MSEIANYLRLLINADQEAKITRVNVTPTPVKFTSQLTSGQTRRRIAVYNNSDSGSGECYFAFSATASPSGEAVPIPKGERAEYLPIRYIDSIDLYFLCDTGEKGDIRVIELA